ncbi:MAG: undecaprenyl-phosphate glucose phosphotransferase [Nitrospinae bacterium]|nr:undecaprenyl-phosphate glucose phosphotransferase [Nitrospinota bacterium]
MLKKHGQLFLSAIFISDSLAIFSSWLLAYFIRFQVPFIPVTQGIPPVGNYFDALIPIWIVFLINIKICDLYQPLRGKSGAGEIFPILKVTSISVLILTAITFFYREFSYSRVVVVYFWVLATLFMVISHWLVRKILSLVRGRGWNLQKVLIVGAGELGQTVAEKLNLHPEIGFQVVGYLTGHAGKIGSSFQGHPVLGEYPEVSKVIREHEVDQLFIALPLKAHDRLEQVLKYLGEETVDVKVVPDLLKYMNIHSGVEEFDGLPIVNLAESPLHGWNVVIKRTSDIILSSLALIISAPLMLLIAALVKMGSSGLVFYRQERMGLDQRVFWMLKFRSMKQEAEKSTGPVWAKENDERRTWIGTFLRKTSLDELPQLFNVLSGEMSLVGPRPERPVFIEDFKQSIPHYMLRLKMKAGLTGWAQVNGWRGNTSLQKRIECDLYYIKNWSLLFDLKILFMTLWKGFINRHAY